MSDLRSKGPHPFDRYRSHQHKPLRVHTDGVYDGTSRRTCLEVAKVAALFHDLGKLNPNFQPKLDDEKVSGYSNHSYLSAYSFLCFCKTNPHLAGPSLGINKKRQFFSALALIAHHHGNLPDMIQILSEGERRRLEEFLAGGPDLPISDYFQQWLEHKPFDVNEAQHRRLLEKWAGMPAHEIAAIPAPLDFFIETQFSFASLVESDKRDAGDNKWFQRDEQLEWARAKAASCLRRALGALTSDNELNRTRTQVRLEALSHLRSAVKDGHRTFSLTAPTGSGKTFCLLALADELKRDYPDHSVVYALPFLTITEQVESICRDVVFNDNPSFVTRIDSRAHDEELEKLMHDLDTHPERIEGLLRRSFSDNTFDAAFIITTFVQLFETLLSNRGSTLQRMPNFSKCVFLIDEIQALPPRLYVFLTAYLQAFCEKFDSFAILSTATMPALILPHPKTDDRDNPRRLFPHYRPPAELLDFEKFYALPIFNRYKIERLDKEIPEFALSDLADDIQSKDDSCLVILNTIDDTKQLYELLCPDGPQPGVVLLNTHFILDDRRENIDGCKKRLHNVERVVLISTQLVEAGVDVDFPVVYRDMCPLPSLIQSAGRCNRNGNREISGIKEIGDVWFFELRGDNGKSRADLIYRDIADKWFLDFSRERVGGALLERHLFGVQREYFDQIGKNLEVGRCKLWVDKKRQKDNLVRRVNEAAFEIVGSFRLIDESDYGAEYRYYVPLGDGDNEWERLWQMTIDAGKLAHAGGVGFDEIKRRQTEIDVQIRTMSGRVVSIRLWDESNAPPALRHKGQVKEVCGLRKLLLPDIYYSSVTGLDLKGRIAAIF